MMRPITRRAGFPGALGTGQRGSDFKCGHAQGLGEEDSVLCIPHEAVQGNTLFLLVVHGGTPEGLDICICSGSGGVGGVANSAAVASPDELDQDAVEELGAFALFRARAHLPEAVY